MSVAELKERHVAASETVNSLRERLKLKRASLLDTDGTVVALLLLLLAYNFNYQLIILNNLNVMIIRSN